MNAMRLPFAIGLVASACVSLDPYRCASDGDCVAASGSGRCEPTSYCSYPDDACDSGQRYSDLAGTLALTCTEPAGPATGDTSSSSGDSGTQGESESGSGDMGGSDGSDSDTGCPPPCTPGGTERWSLVLPGDEVGHDALLSLLALPGGDLVAGGYTQNATRDAWLMRLTTGGDIVTSRTFDADTDVDQATAIALSNDGDIWVCGRGDSTTGFRAWIALFDATIGQTPLDEAFIAHDVCEEVGIAQSDAVVASGREYGSAGPYAWTHRFPPWAPEGGTTWFQGGPDSTDGLRASVRTDAAFLVGGSLDRRGVVFSMEGDAMGPMLVQTDGDGGVQGLAAADDWFVVAGFEDSASTLHEGWISARDEGGGERWTYRPAEPSATNDEYEAVTIDPVGDIVAVGFGGQGSIQRVVTKLSSEGEPKWSIVLPHHAPEAKNPEDIARDVVVLPDGDIVVVGQVTAADGTLDAWVARLSP